MVGLNLQVSSDIFLRTPLYKIQTCMKIMRPVNNKYEFLLFFSGGLAVIFALFSNSDTETGRYKSATTKSKISLILSIVGIICGVIMYLAVICVIVIIHPKDT